MLPAAGQHWKQKARKNSNDRDDHQKFNQGETG